MNKARVINYTLSYAEWHDGVFLGIRHRICCWTMTGLGRIFLVIAIPFFFDVCGIHDLAYVIWELEEGTDLHILNFIQKEPFISKNTNLFTLPIFEK